MDQGLQVAVQVLVGVEYWGIGWQEEDLDVFCVLVQPVPDLVAVMYSQVVQNQKYLAPSLSNQTCQKPDQHGGGHRLPVEHETHFPLIGDRRDHVRGKSTTRHVLNRRIACRCIGTR